MKIEYKTTLDISGEPCNVSEVRHMPCCSEMGKAYACDGDYDCMSFGDESGQGKAAIFLTSEEFGYYGDRTTNYHKIDFCPFCGAKIECEEVERIKTVQKIEPIVIPAQAARHEVRVTTHEEVVWKKDA